MSPLSQLVVGALILQRVEVRFVDINALAHPPIRVGIGSEPAHNLHLAVDGTAKGVTAGGEEGARVLVLQHNLFVPIPVITLAHHLPNIARVTDPVLAEC